MGAEVGELIAVQAVDRGVERGAAATAGGGEAHANDAAIVGAARACDPAALVKPVHEAGDVGDAVDELRADLGAGHACARALDQDPQHVELRRGQPVAPEQRLELGGQPVVDLHQRQVGVAGGGICERLRHTPIFRCNDTCCNEQ